mmetsp:Transcript_121125/g.214257  ORF Transcript_121125/g.214257 Transcript_121125/m.214257 type:complete len:216 (+) Transcript_121125:458-1105(+)
MQRLHSATCPLRPRPSCWGKGLSSVAGILPLCCWGGLQKLTGVRPAHRLAIILLASVSLQNGISKMEVEVEAKVVRMPPASTAVGLIGTAIGRTILRQVIGLAQIVATTTLQRTSNAAIVGFHAQRKQAMTQPPPTILGVNSQLLLHTIHLRTIHLCSSSKMPQGKAHSRKLMRCPSRLTRCPSRVMTCSRQQRMKWLHLPAKRRQRQSQQRFNF